MVNYLILKDTLTSDKCKQWTTQELFEEAKKENPSIQIESVYKIMKQFVKKNKVEKVRGYKCYYTWKEL